MVEINAWGEIIRNKKNPESNVVINFRMQFFAPPTAEMIYKKKSKAKK